MEELESVPGQKDVWSALLSLLPLQPTPDKRMIMTEWMDFVKIWLYVAEAPASLLSGHLLLITGSVWTYL